MASRSVVALAKQTLTTTTTGASDSTPLPQNEAFTASLIIDGPVTGTTPTLNVVVQVNPDPGLDAAAWETVATFPQQTAALAAPVTQAIAAGALGSGPRRVVATVGGTTPSFAGVEVVLG